MHYTATAARRHVSPKPTNLRPKEINKRTMEKAPKLRDTFLVVPLGTVGAQCIDTGPFASKDLVKCKEGDLPFYINRYNRWFWDQVDCYGRGEGSAVNVETDRLIEVWQTNGFLMLSHQHFGRDSHAGVIIDYLMWVIRKRGLDTRN